MSDIFVLRKIGETDSEYRARAFRINRDYNLLLGGSDPLNHLAESNPVQATRMTRDELRNTGTVLQKLEYDTMSMRRAIWYSAGLVAGVAVTVVAVFGMGH